MIITTSLGIIITIYVLILLLGEADTLVEYIGYTALSLLLGGIVLLLGVVVSSFIGEHLPANYTLSSSAPIVALKDNKITDGNFFLGCGSIDRDLHYYYAEDSSKGYKVKSVDIDKCYILFDDDHPRIERYDVTSFNKKRHYIYAIPYGYYYKLYVPHGSITTEFKVDLE